MLALRFSDKLAKSKPEWFFWVWLGQAVFWIAAVTLTIANPLFDLVLRLDPEGRRALTPDKLKASNWNGVCLLLALLVMAIWAASKGGRLLPPMALALTCLTMAINATYSASEGWVRKRMQWITVLAGLLIPGSYIVLLVFLVALVNSKGTFVPPIQLPFYMVGASLLISAFADELAAYFEKQRPDKIH